MVIVIMHNMIVGDEEGDFIVNHKYLLELCITSVEQYWILQPLTFEQLHDNFWAFNKSINILNYMTTLWNTCDRLK
jgi:hypothetical protein